MKVDVSKQIYHINGDLIPSDEKGTPLTVKIAIIRALVALKQDDKAEDKVTKFFLARKIQESEGEIDLTAEEIVLIKNSVGTMFSPEVVGTVWETLA